MGRKPFSSRKPRKLDIETFVFEQGGTATKGEILAFASGRLSPSECVRAGIRYHERQARFWEKKGLIHEIPESNELLAEQGFRSEVSRMLDNKKQSGSMKIIEGHGASGVWGLTDLEVEYQNWKLEQQD